MRQGRYGTTSKWDVPRRRRLLRFRWLTPPRLFIGSFAVMVVLGAVGLRYLPGLYTGERLNWVDAFFTSTSAVCVTGLIVVDTATYFTTAGQAYILLLIQLGGLGMLAFTSLIIVALGRRLSLRQEALSSETREVAPHLDTRRLTVDVVRFTLVLEAIGSLALYALWVPRFGWAGAAWPAVFHSVSAFCNAGFSVFSDSLVGFQDAPFTLAVIMLLIVVGGIGFLTLEEVYLRWRAERRKQAFRVSLHSRIVIVTTLALLVGGWILFGFFEWNHTLADLSTGHKLDNALFLSVTARTAGFNTVDYVEATESTNFLTIILMMIGGSPGSTAGGIKTTTFALIGLLAWSRLMGYEKTTFWSRSVREETTERAVGLFVLAFGLVVLGVFVLTITENRYPVEGKFLDRMFEVVSAFNTVGLSMGVTPSLTIPSRWLIIVLMFCGRVGPFAVAAAIAIRRPAASSFRYAYEDVVVG